MVSVMRKLSDESICVSIRNLVARLVLFVKILVSIQALELKKENWNIINYSF